MTVPPDRPPSNVPQSFGPGVWVQVYRDAIQHHDEVPIWLDRYQLLDVVGVVWHGFPQEDPAWLDPLMRETHARGMRSGASEGLDTKFRSGAQKGESLGRLSRDHKADVIGLDGESHFDPLSAKQEAVDMVAAFRSYDATVIAFDQPWPQPDSHPHWPYVEMAEGVQARADQRYLKPWRPILGKRRYQTKWPEWETQWQHLENHVLAPVNALRQRIVTIEQYDYSDIMADGCEIVVRHPTIVAWGEPWSDPSFIAMLKVRQFLSKHSFIDAAWSNAEDAIMRFQIDHNKTASSKISVDGRAGLKETIPAMGIRF